jgi:ligand-binding SRPBCC domain-containing protein
MKKTLTCAFALMLGLLPVTGRPDDVASAVKQIDSDCSAIQSATMALKPIHFALISSKWKVMSDADYTVAEQTHASVAFADVWTQGKNPAWVHSHTFTASGTQRATQLCFRQADGTLERVRQAATVDDLGGAAAEQAYYASDGTVIQKTSLFAVNDPAIAKKVADLPFYSMLP